MTNAIRDKDSLSERSWASPSELIPGDYDPVPRPKTTAPSSPPLSASCLSSLFGRFRSKTPAPEMRLSPRVEYRTEAMQSSHTPPNRKHSKTYTEQHDSNHRSQSRPRNYQRPRARDDNWPTVVYNPGVREGRGRSKQRHGRCQSPRHPKEGTIEHRSHIPSGRKPQHTRSPCGHPSGTLCYCKFSAAGDVGSQSYYRFENHPSRFSAARAFIPPASAVAIPGSPISRPASACGYYHDNVHPSCGPHGCAFASKP